MLAKRLPGLLHGGQTYCMKSFCERNLGWLLWCGIVLSHGGVAACRE